MEPLDDDLREAAFNWVLGEAEPVMLVRAARAALASGRISPALDLLAMLQAYEADEAEPLFARALEELGVPPPTRAEALVGLARLVARDIVSGRTSPAEGAAAIACLTRLHPDTYEGMDHLLDDFIYADDELGERPDEPCLVEGVLLAAHELGE